MDIRKGNLMNLEGINGKIKTLFMSSLVMGVANLNEALVNVVGDFAWVWAENRSPLEYVIPANKQLGWLVETNGMTEWVLGQSYSPRSSGMKKGTRARM